MQSKWPAKALSSSIHRHNTQKIMNYPECVVGRATASRGLSSGRVLLAAAASHLAKGPPGTALLGWMTWTFVTLVVSWFSWLPDTGSARGRICRGPVDHHDGTEKGTHARTDVALKQSKERSFCAGGSSLEKKAPSPSSWRAKS